MVEVHTLPQRTPPEKSGFCMTPTAKNIMDVLGYCQRDGQFGVILGESGTGKSTALAEYAEEHRDTCLCRMSKTASGLQPGLLHIAKAVGAYAPANSGGYEVYQAIADRLRLYGDQLLILDEAQHMSDELLETMRDLYDEGSIGIVLAGHPSLADRWTDRSSKRRHSYFAQLRGRIGGQLPTLTTPLPEDIVALCEHHGIAGRREQAIVKKAAKHPGQLHQVKRLLDLARQNAGPGSRITVEHLETAGFMLGIAR